MALLRIQIPIDSISSIEVLVPEALEGTPIQMSVHSISSI